uniref:Uncharacterized protein n=1 Tax=Molossus molossus TaxID=27622 RepID=A0A7J8CRY9_MOLMO|nr:hypothetical protein HJG59_009737 [Molossus molossus]
MPLEAVTFGKRCFCRGMCPTHVSSRTEPLAGEVQGVLSEQGGTGASLEGPTEPTTRLLVTSSAWMNLVMLSCCQVAFFGKRLRQLSPHTGVQSPWCQGPYLSPSRLQSKPRRMATGAQRALNK